MIPPPLQHMCPPWPARRPPPGRGLSAPQWPPLSEWPRPAAAASAAAGQLRQTRAWCKCGCMVQPQDTIPRCILWRWQGQPTVHWAAPLPHPSPVSFQCGKRSTHCSSEYWRSRSLVSSTEGSFTYCLPSLRSLGPGEGGRGVWGKRGRVGGQLEAWQSIHVDDGLSHRDLHDPPQAFRLQCIHRLQPAHAPKVSSRSSAVTAPPAAAATFSLHCRTLSSGSASISSSCTAPLRMQLPKPTCTRSFTCDARQGGEAGVRLVAWRRESGGSGRRSPPLPSAAERLPLLFPSTDCLLTLLARRQHAPWPRKPKGQMGWPAAGRGAGGFDRLGVRRVASIALHDMLSSLATGRRPNDRPVSRTQQPLSRGGR